MTDRILTRRTLNMQNNYINSTRKGFISNTNEKKNPSKVFSNEIIYLIYKRKNKIPIHINIRIYNLP